MPINLLGDRSAPILIRVIRERTLTFIRLTGLEMRIPGTGWLQKRYRDSSHRKGGTLVDDVDDSRI